MGHNSGAVTDEGNQLSVRWENREHADYLPTKFVLLRWGPWRYLVPPEEVLRFCIDIRTGGEYGPKSGGLHFVRTVDASGKPVGEPELPPEYERYRKMEAIRGRITSVGRLETQPNSRTEFGINVNEETVTVKLTLDIGSDAGVLAGMNFKTFEAGGPYATIRVTKVGQRQSEALACFTRSQGNQTTLRSGAQVTYY
jgi:hypothetical protein